MVCTMSKAEVVKAVEATGAKVLRIIKFADSYKVSIDWTDYLKVRGVPQLRGIYWAQRSPWR